MRLLLIISCLLLCFNTKAKENVVYPAEINGKWGMITKYGRFVLPPKHDQFIYTPNLPVYAFAQHTNEIKSIANLLVYDTMGLLLLNYKDSVFSNYAQEYYKPRTGRLSIRNYIANALGFDQIEKPKTNYNFSTTTSAYSPIKLNPSYESPDSSIRLADEKRRAFFKVGLSHAKYSYACKIFGSLYLVNLGGYTEYEYSPSERSGCVVTPSIYNYEPVKGGKWGVVDINNKVIIDIKYANRESIALFYTKKSYLSHRIVSKCIVIGEAIPGTLSRRNIIMLNDKGELIYKGDDPKAAYSPFAFNNYVLLSIKSSNENNYLVFNNSFEIVDTFYKFSRGVDHGDGFIAQNAKGWHYYNSGSGSPVFISGIEGDLEYLDDNYFKHKINENQWHVYNIKTGRRTAINSKHFKRFGTYHIRFYRNDSTFIVNLLTGEISGFKGGFGINKGDEIFYSKYKFDEGRPTFVEATNTTAKPFDNLLLFEGYALYTDSFVIDSNGKQLLRSKYNEVAYLGVLLVTSDKKSYSYNHSNNLYINSEYLWLREGNVHNLTLSSKKNFATLSYYKSYWNKNDITRALVYFPKRDKFIIFNEGELIKETRDFGGVLAIKVYSKVDKENQWLFFNDKGKRIAQNGFTNVGYKKANLKTLRIKLWMSRNNI